MTDTEYIKIGRFTALALKSGISGENLPEKPADISWGQVYSFSKSHSLSNMVFSSYESEIKKDAPEELVQLWERETHVLFAKHTTQKNEFSRVTSEFTKQGIDFLPLKGFLMKALYPRPEFRTMSDLDFLIREGDVGRAGETVKSMGYKGVSEDEDNVHDTFQKPPFMDIELHRKLFADSEYSFDDAVLKEGESHWYLMTDEDFLCFILRHSKKHYEQGGCGMRAVLDHYLLLKKYPKVFLSPEFEERLRKAGLYDFNNLISSLAFLWFEGIEPEGDISGFEVYTLTGGTYGTYANAALTGMKKKGKFGYVLERVFPSPSLIKKRYKWVRKCPILLPVGYVVRIFSSIIFGDALAYIRAIKHGKKRMNDENQKAE